MAGLVTKSQLENNIFILAQTLNLNELAIKLHLVCGYARLRYDGQSPLNVSQYYPILLFNSSPN